MEIKWTRAARKHHISQNSVRFVVENPTYRGPLPAPSDSPALDPRILFVGPDRNGVELEVMAVELADDRLLVIHAMKLRDKYRHYLEEASPE